MSKAIALEIGTAAQGRPHRQRRWVFLRPAPPGFFPGRLAAQAR